MSEHELLKWLAVGEEAVLRNLQARGDPRTRDHIAAEFQAAQAIAAFRIIGARVEGWPFAVAEVERFRRLFSEHAAAPGPAGGAKGGE